MAAGQGGFFFSLTFCVILIRISQDRSFNHGLNEDFYHPDVSAYLLRGSDDALRYFEAVELWSTSNFDSRQRAFVPGDCLHYLTRNKKCLYSLSMKHIFVFSLLRSGDVHPHPGPRTENLDCSKSLEQNNSAQTKKFRRPKFPCVTCGKGVIGSSKAIDCDLCSRWTHIKCTGYITDSRYNDLCSQDSDTFSFICSECSINSLPFNGEEDVGSSLDETVITQGTTRPSLTDPDHYECFKRKGLHFLHLNVRSLVNKISEIRLLASKTRAAVISLSETWLDDSVLDNEISIGDYCLVRRDRNRNGGGVCMFIRSDIPFSHRHDLSSDDLEILCCDILLPKTRPILVGACYRPPKQNDFIDKLEELLFKVRTDSEIYLLGDFNICFFFSKMLKFIQKVY